VQGNLDYDTTRTSELSNYNVVTSPVRHLGGTVAPQISYNFLPTDRLILAGSYAASQYQSSSFANYSVASVSPSYKHDFDPRNTGILSLQAQRYSTTSGPANTVDSFGPSFGWTRKISEKMTAGVSAGAQETRQKQAGIPNLPWKLQYDFAGNLNYTGLQDTIAAVASRSQYPFGNGTEAFLTQISLNETHGLNDLFSVGAGGSYQMADYQANSPSSIKTMATGTANLTYHITDEWDTTASYQYRYETLIGISATPRENMGMLNLVYRPKSWSL
jgi:hypothetical protein